jgi:hypothetical protein
MDITARLQERGLEENERKQTPTIAAMKNIISTSLSTFRQASFG